MCADFRVKCASNLPIMDCETGKPSFGNIGGNTGEYMPNCSGSVFINSQSRYQRICGAHLFGHLILHNLARFFTNNLSQIALNSYSGFAVSINLISCWVIAATPFYDCYLTFTAIIA